ncbi:hypothetical protein [Sulfuriferula sp.]|uniref:hypothetical protein n=1 Tax=Sulfuriferula sp. TaxID=2025307 RepID=UPI002731E165|nr:hypothetical protein [Sulfuriferula sp.]
MPHLHLHEIYLHIPVLLKVGKKEQDTSRFGRLLGAGIGEPKKKSLHGRKCIAC